MNKRLSTQQKMILLINRYSSLTIGLYKGKYTAIVLENGTTLSQRSKSISRAISELYKYYNETK